MNDPLQLSVVVPVSERCDDAATLLKTYREGLDRIGRKYEMVFVLDGDFPEFRSKLEEAASGRSDIRIVQLGKRFGESTALSAGFDTARSELILTLPSYVQVDIAHLASLFDMLESADMVLVKRWPRVDSQRYRMRTRMLNKVVNMLTGSGFEDLGCGVRLLKRAVIEEVPIYGDQHRFMPILAARRGFRVVQVELPQAESESHRVSPPWGAYPRRFLDLLTVFFLVKFTKKPLRFFGLIGCGFLAIGGISLAVVVVQRLFFGVGLADRPALLLASLLAVLGVQLLAIGLVGEIVIFTHARDIKEYTIEEIVN